jgi:hypothetical protein
MRYSRRTMVALAGAAGVFGARAMFGVARAESAVSGTFTANGKATTLTQVTAHKGEPVFNKPVTELVFTAMDQKGDPKAAFNATFHKYGDAIIAKVTAEGKLVGTELVHSGWRRPGMALSVSGSITMEDFSLKDGEMSGRIVTDGVQEAFSDKFEVNLTFKVKAP